MTLALLLLSDKVFKSKGDRRKLDWDTMGREAVLLLSQYLRSDTTNPPGNEDRATDFLSGILSRESIDFQIYESAPGRSNLYARLRGDGSKRPIILLSHSDVVPADRSHWSVDPFGGVGRTSLRSNSKRR